MTNAMTTKQAAALNALRAAAHQRGATIECLGQQDGVELVAVDEGGKSLLLGIDRDGRTVR